MREQLFCGPAPAILSFTGGHRYLSNFYPSPIPFGNETAPTVEHAFQAAKSYHPELGLRILTAATPIEAKKMGRGVTLRPDWEASKLGVMRHLLSLKFAAGTPLAGSLIATGDALLVEGNTWGDRFWGAVDGQGFNWLGHLLMARRAELRAGI